MNYVSMSVYLGACLCVSASGCVCVEEGKGRGTIAVTRDRGKCRGGGRGVRVGKRREGRGQTDQGHTVMWIG